MKTNKELNVNGIIIHTINVDGNDYISLTDIASLKNTTAPKDVVRNWMRNRMTVLFLGLWEQLNNNDFKGVEFDSFRNHAGENAFTLSPEQWIEKLRQLVLFQDGDGITEVPLPIVKLHSSLRAGCR